MNYDRLFDASGTTPFDPTRAYRRGDTLRQVVWKVFIAIALSIFGYARQIDRHRVPGHSVRMCGLWRAFKGMSQSVRRRPPPRRR